MKSTRYCNIFGTLPGGKQLASASVLCNLWKEIIWDLTACATHRAAKICWPHQRLPVLRHGHQSPRHRLPPSVHPKSPCAPQTLVLCPRIHLFYCVAVPPSKGGHFSISASLLSEAGSCLLTLWRRIMQDSNKSFKQKRHKGYIHSPFFFLCTSLSLERN